MNSFISFLCLSLVGTMCVAADPDEKTTILALGDSITAGGKSFTCYREVLVPALKNNAVEFIGPVEGSISRHAGYGGKNTAFLRSKIQEIYKEFPADIILIHAGHNCFAENEPVPGIIADTEAIIRTIHDINPRSIVLLAQVIPSGKLPKYSYIPKLNQELAGLSEQLQQDALKVVLVDQATGFDWEIDTVGDRVHPSQSGAKKMAAQWLDALQPLMNK